MPKLQPPLRAIILDLDGTLIDSLADLATAVNRMLEQNGYPRQPLALFPRYIGDGMRKLVERALPEPAREESNVTRCMAQYMEHYAACWHDQTRVYEGMAESLATLREHGLKIGVISNKPDVFTRMCCDYFFANGAFDAVLGQRDGVPRKPEPDAGVEMLREFGVSADQCAYVGDSGVDMRFGAAAGMRRIGVTWGFRDEMELRENGAEFLIRSPGELTEFV